MHQNEGGNLLRLLPNGFFLSGNMKDDMTRLRMDPSYPLRNDYKDLR